MIQLCLQGLHLGNSCGRAKKLHAFLCQAFIADRCLNSCRLIQIELPQSEYGRAAAGKSLVPPAGYSSEACLAVLLMCVSVPLFGGSPEVLQDSSKIIISVQLLQVLFWHPIRSVAPALCWHRERAGSSSR